MQKASIQFHVLQNGYRFSRGFLDKIEADVDGGRMDKLEALKKLSDLGNLLYTALQNGYRIVEEDTDGFFKILDPESYYERVYSLFDKYAPSPLRILK